MPVAVGTCGARGVPRRLVPRRGILLSAPPRRNRCVLLLGDAVCSSHIMQRFRLARVCHIHRHTCRSPSAASSNEGLVDSDAGGIQHERTDGAAAEGVASHPGNGRIAAWHGESRRVAMVVLAAVGARREGRVRQATRAHGSRSFDGFARPSSWRLMVSGVWRRIAILYIRIPGTVGSPG